MIKVLFVCYGNICRSPMAEFILKDIVNKKGIANIFIIESAATCNEEVGNPIYYLAKEKLKEKGIYCDGKTARKLIKNDYNNYDYIIGMEERNIEDIKNILGIDGNEKIYKLMDFTGTSKDIADPWYTRDFEETYNDIYLGCIAFLKSLNI